MEKALILSNVDFEKFSEIRHANVQMGISVVLYKRGMLPADEAFRRVIVEIEKADDAMEVLTKGGL
jgi:hypothetical protein